VAGNFLGRWFGGSRPVPPSVAEAAAELDRLAKERPALGSLCRWLRDLLPDMASEEKPVGAVRLTWEAAEAKLAKGVPMLRGERLELDIRGFRRRWQRACDLLDSAQGQGAGAGLAEALRRGKLEPGGMIDAVVAGEPGGVRDAAEKAGLDGSLTMTLLRYTLFPEFVALATTMTPLRERVAWERGYCPVCGSWPLLGEFRGLDQSRLLRCGLCASAWEVPRTWCAYCDSRDHEQLRFLHAEGEESRYRALVCDGCRGYVKMLTTLSALPSLHLAIADLVMLHLDLAAAERGYTNQG
jgi:FdhE protein